MTTSIKEILGNAAVSGHSGRSGYSGFTGYSGYTGKSGYSGFTGYSGRSGYSGQDGTSVSILGSVNDYTTLPGGASAGDLYIVLNAGGGYAAGDGAVSDGIGGWSNIGPIRGPTGTSGYSGFTGYSGAPGPSGTINATADGISTTLYPVFVPAIGSNQPAKANASFIYNASNNALGLGAATDVATKTQLLIQGTNSSTNINTLTADRWHGGAASIGVYNSQAVDGGFAALSLRPSAASTTGQTASILARSVTSGFAPDLVFAARTDTAVMTERMVIAANGNFGFACTTPGYFFDAVGSVIRFAQTTTSGFGYIQIGRSATATQNYYLGSQGDGNFYILQGNYGTGTQRLRITSEGYVHAGIFNTNWAAENGTASHYFYMSSTDGYIRNKTLANVKTEIVTSAAVIAGLGYTPVSKDATGLGVVNDYALDSVTNTAAEWAALPVGYARMFINNNAAGGAPDNGYGYFIKTANRDSGGGWGGLWIGYGGGESYVGDATVSSGFATWRKIWTASNLTNNNQLGNGYAYANSSNSLGINGNAATATHATTSNTFSSGRTNYKGTTDNAVAGQLMWKHYGNSHTIFDASNSTDPAGGAVNNTNAAVAWGSTYPTLMGWNGSSTYGVRVDSARIADTASAGWPTNLTSYTNGTNYANATNGYAINGNAATATTAALTSITVGGTTEGNLLYGNMADNDQFRIRIGGTATNAGWVEIATADDGTEPIYVRQYTGVFGVIARTLTLLDGSGNSSFPGAVTVNGTLTLNSSVPTIQGVSPPNGAMRMTPNFHLNAGDGSAVILNWDNGTTGTEWSLRVGNGAGSDAFYVRADGYVRMIGSDGTLSWPAGAKLISVDDGASSQLTVACGTGAKIWLFGASHATLASQFHIGVDTDGPFLVGTNSTLTWNNATIIHSNNIGSQNVNYAGLAGAVYNSDTATYQGARSASIASSVVSRDGSGYVFAVIYNMTFGVENTAAGEYVYLNGSDGYMRRKSLANVKAEIVTAASVDTALQASAVVELGRGGSGDRDCVFDFHAAGTPGAVDYHARLHRVSGTNGSFYITQTGSGSMLFITNGSTRAEFQGAGPLYLHRMDTGSEGAEVAWARAGDNSIRWITDINGESWRLYNNGGSTGVYLANGSQTWAAVSDMTLKEDVVDIQSALGTISSIRWIKYHLRDVDTPSSKLRLGVSAQDLLGKMDEVVDVIRTPIPNTDNGRGRPQSVEKFGVRYGDMIPMMGAAIKELNQKIADLQAEINILKQ